MTVEREVVLTPQSPPDLVASFSGRGRVVMAAKVLSPLQLPALQLYTTDGPGALAYLAVRPDALHAEATEGIGWRTVTWEHLLNQSSTSTDNWTAATASA